MGENRESTEGKQFLLRLKRSRGSREEGFAWRSCGEGKDRACCGAGQRPCFSPAGRRPGPARGPFPSLLMEAGRCPFRLSVLGC